MDSGVWGLGVLDWGPGADGMGDQGNGGAGGLGSGEYLGCGRGGGPGVEKTMV